MTGRSPQYSRVLPSFMGILLFFLVTINILIVSRQRSLLLEEAQGHMENEMGLMGTFVREPLLRHDYAKVEQFILQWAEEHEEIINVKAIMPNGFVLIDYVRSITTSDTYYLEQEVQYAGKNLILLKVVRDFSPVERILGRLRKQLIAGSFVLTFIFGTVLWITVKKMAMIPLEEEIAVRREAEEMLQQAKDDLEIRVRERTKELDDINRDLLREIDGRRKIETALLESEEKYRLLVEDTDTGFVVVDDKGVVVEVNEPYLRLAGARNFKEVLGRSVIEWTAPESREENAAAVARCVKDGSVQDFETIYLRPDGSRVNILINATMHTTSQGIHLTALCRDITERKKIEKDRERMNVELALKNRELEQIIYASSHDLRTPLVNIHGFSKELDNSVKELVSLVHESLQPADVRERVNAITVRDIPESLRYITLSVSRMDALLNGLLKLSRLGRDELKIEEIDMNRLLSDVLSMFEFQIKEQDVKMEVSPLPACMGDEMQLNQVFSNLLENALKYLGNSNPGIIRVAGNRENGQSVYCIEDNGIGIAPENQGKIFEIFHQIEPGKRPGEGLGLSIVQRIIQRHRGKIWIESEPDRGTRFFISLPFGS